MRLFPSWSWLTSTPSLHHPRQTPVVRPCLSAVELLDDRVLLSAAAVQQASAVASSPQNNQPIETLLKWEGDVIKFQDGLLATELKLLKMSESQMSSATANYFLKLDKDLTSIDTDLAGGGSSVGNPVETSESTSAASNKIGGIDAAIIAANRQFSGLALADGLKIQADRALMVQVDAALLKIANGDGGTPADAVEDYLKLEDLKFKEQVTANELNATFLKLETQFVGTNFESSMKSLGGDLATVPVDTAPQNTLAFDAALKFEDEFLKVQDSFLKLEAQYLKIQGGSSRLTNTFLELDNEFLKIDFKLAGASPSNSNSAATTTEETNSGGLNAMFLDGNLPADVIAEIRDVWTPTIYKAEAEITADIAALQPPDSGLQ